MSPKISIIVPCYNVEKYLRQCLDTLVNQTFTDIEIICIDDKSTDGTLSILHEYAKSYPKILHVIAAETNCGLSATRNRGIEVARGQYIMFVDSDDWCDPQMCEIAYNTIEETGAELAEFGSVIITEAGNLESLYVSRAWGTNAMDVALHREMPPVVWNKIYRRDIIMDKNLRFVVGSNNEDLGFNVCYSLWCKHVTFIPRYMYFYRRRQGSIMSNQCKSQLVLTDPIGMINGCMDYFTKMGRFESDADWFWDRVFCGYLWHALTYSDKKYHRHIYKWAKKFIAQNYDPALITRGDIRITIENSRHGAFFPGERLSLSLVRFAQKNACIFLEILGLCVWCKKFKPNSISTYICGIRVYRKRYRK